MRASTFDGSAEWQAAIGRSSPNLFAEPVFILSPSGMVLEANTAARRLHGADPTGLDLATLIASPRTAFEDWLRRCSGTAQPLLGALTFTHAAGPGRRMRAYGARLGGNEEPVRIGVRCVPYHADEFSVLARKIRELNAEVRERRRTQAVLEESLAHNELLLRELHHRVKNNIQMLAGLFSAAQREAHSEEVRGFLAGANARLMAIGAARRLQVREPQGRRRGAVPDSAVRRDTGNAGTRGSPGRDCRRGRSLKRDGFPPGADHQRACHERIQAWLGWGRWAGYGLAARRCRDCNARRRRQWTGFHARRRFLAAVHRGSGCTRPLSSDRRFPHDRDVRARPVHGSARPPSDLDLTPMNLVTLTAASSDPHRGVLRAVSEGGQTGPGLPRIGSVLIVEDEWLVSMEIEALLEDAGYQTVGVAVSADEAVRWPACTGPTSS